MQKHVESERAFAHAGPGGQDEKIGVIESGNGRVQIGKAGGQSRHRLVAGGQLVQAVVDPQQDGGDMLQSLGLSSSERLKTLSKGTKEKVQLIVTMARKAKLYLLDEPIGGVDPAARDYILNTILTNYSEDSTVIISTHLIADIERVLDEIVFLKNGEMTLYDTVDNIREREGKSVDQLFREVFAC